MNVNSPREPAGNSCTVRCLVASLQSLAGDARLPYLCAQPIARQAGRGRPGGAGHASNHTPCGGLEAQWRPATSRERGLPDGAQVGAGSARHRRRRRCTGAVGDICALRPGGTAGRWASAVSAGAVARRSEQLGARPSASSARAVPQSPPHQGWGWSGVTGLCVGSPSRSCPRLELSQIIRASNHSSIIGAGGGQG